jgi:LysM repeat protein
VQNFQPTQAWSGSDANAQSFGPQPLWSYFQVLAPPSGPRFKVLVASTGGVAYVDQSAVGPSGPPSGGAPAAAPAASTQAQTITVKKGDTLFSIAESLGVSPSDLASANNIGSDGKILIGQTLTVPGKGSSTPAAAAPAPAAAPAAPAPAPKAATKQITIQDHDTLSKLAAKYGATVAQLQALNHLDDPDSIQSGQPLLVPA